MAILDLSNPVCLLRLRCGDTRDIPFLPDEVYQQAIIENNGNLKSATILCAQYILAQLAFRSQQSLATLTVYGNQLFQQYKEYITMLVKDPSFSGISPIPYSGDNGIPPVKAFSNNWYSGCDCSVYMRSESWVKE